MRYKHREHIPAELKALPQWVGWNYEEVGTTAGTRLAKVPYSLETGARASTRNPKTWAPYSACASHENVGFVFAARDPYAGIDLDDCLAPATGQLSFVARVVVRHLGSYAEVSPSGRGVKVFVRARIPGARRQNRRLGVEMYDASRFFAMTGARLSGIPARIAERDLEPLYRWVFGAEIGENAYRARGSRRPRERNRSDGEILRRALGAANGAKFERLWRGDHSGYPTRSEADLALCAMLAYWCEADPTRVEALFSRSGLCREKWRLRPDYRRRTIARAIAGLPAPLRQSTLSPRGAYLTGTGEEEILSPYQDPV